MDEKTIEKEIIMANNLEKKSNTEITTPDNKGFHPIQAVKDWWFSLPPWGRALFSLGGLGAGTFIAHDAMEHDLIPDIKIGKIFELTMRPKDSDDD